MQRNFKNSCAGALFVLALASINVMAAEGQFYVAPGIQWIEFDDQTHLDNDTGLFLGLGYDITDQWSVEFSIIDGLEPNADFGSDPDIDIWKVDLLYGLDMIDLGPLEPFILTGFGNGNFDGEDETLWDFGAGVNYELTDNLTWRTAVRGFDFLGTQSEDRDVGVETALVWHFGGANRSSRPSSPSRPAVAETPRSTSPASEPDSDGDGVPDSRDACPDTPRNYAVDSRGCPIPVEEVARVELEVNFDFDRSEVLPQYFPEIQEVADFMDQYPDVIVELEGHTDGMGTELYNQGLSQRRADAVRQVLIDRFDIQATRVSATGYGESQPVASNNTAAGRAQNRRVITVIVRTLQNYQPR